MDMDFKSYIIPSVLCGVIVFVEDTLTGQYLPDNPFLWVDVGGNVFSYISSKLILEYSFDKMFNAGFFENGFNLVAQPLLHGTFNGLISEFAIDRPSVRGLSQFPTRLRQIPKDKHSNFYDGFTHGATLNIMSTYLSLPILGL